MPRKKSDKTSTRNYAAMPLDKLMKLRTQIDRAMEARIVAERDRLGDLLSDLRIGASGRAAGKHPAAKAVKRRRKRRTAATAKGAKVKKTRKTRKKAAKAKKIARNGKPRSAVAPKYRNPKDRSQTWSGRGRQPRWLTTAVAAGAKQQDFAIA